MNLSISLYLQSYGVETVHTSNQGKNYADLKITIDVLSSIDDLYAKALR